MDRLRQLVNGIINRSEPRAFWYEKDLCRAASRTQRMLNPSRMLRSIAGVEKGFVPRFKRVCHWSTGTQSRDATPRYLCTCIFWCTYICVCVWYTRNSDTLNLREINILPAIPMASSMAEPKPFLRHSETFALDHPKRYKDRIQA